MPVRPAGGPPRPGPAQPTVTAPQICTTEPAGGIRKHFGEYHMLGLRQTELSPDDSGLVASAG